MDIDDTFSVSRYLVGWIKAESCAIADVVVDSEYRRIQAADETC